MINARYLNQLRDDIIKRDEKNLGKLEGMSYDKNLFILKGALEKVLRILPNLPYSKITIVDNTDRIYTISINSEDEIKYGKNSITNFKRLITELFNTDTNIYKYYPFSEYINNKKELIDLLFQYGLEYVLLHEYSHIKDGHLKFLENNPKYKNNIDLLRTLEYHADNSALCTILGIYEVVNHNNKLEEKMNNVALICIAVYLQISMIKHKDYIWDILDVEDFNNSKDTTHPLFGFRQYSIFNSIKGKLGKLYYDESMVELFMERVSIAIGNTERVRQGSEEISCKKMPMLITLTHEGHDALKKIHNTWEWVKKLIEPYSYMNLCEFNEWVDTEPGDFLDDNPKK